MARKKRKVAHPTLPMQRQFVFPEGKPAGTGRYFDLEAIFHKLNERYFSNRLRRYTIVWGQRRRERPTYEIVFGTIQEEDRMIRVHPLLDRAFIPRWFVEYVVYHEMCHAVVPDRYTKAGRRVVHHEGFWERERRYRFFKRAKKWEGENLGRFLR